MVLTNDDSRLTCYYIGPIQYAWRFGQQWREYADSLLRPIGVIGFNPNTLEATILNKNIKEITAERKKWKETGQWKKFHKEMWDIRVLDIALGVLGSDFVVLFWPIGVEKGGTLDELYCAARCGIPILVVIRGHKRDMNDWVYDVLLELEKGEYSQSIKTALGAGLTRFARIFTSFKAMARWVEDHREELLIRKKALRVAGVLELRRQLAPLFLRPGIVFDYISSDPEHFLRWLDLNPAYKVDDDVARILERIHQEKR
jgi:hypothetical protein